METFELGNKKNIVFTMFSISFFVVIFFKDSLFSPHEYQLCVFIVLTYNY